MNNAGVMDERNKIINFNVSKLRSFTQRHEKIDKATINQVLDELNVVEDSSVSPSEKFDCIRLCCASITFSDGMLLGKCSQVIMKFIQKEILSDPMVHFILDWCLTSLGRVPDITQSEMLAVLLYLIVHWGNTCRQFTNDILRTLKDPLENKTKLVCPGEILLQKLTCIRELVPLMSYTHYHVVKDILIQITRKNLSIESAIKAKVIIAELEILTIIGEKNTTWVSENIGVILGICLSFASYGLPHHVKSVPQYMLPSPLLSESEGNKSSASKAKKKRKQKKNIFQKIQSTPLDDIVPELHWSQTSESDFSDSEVGQLALSKKLERKIRLNSMSLLLYISKNVDKKELMGYWPNILSGPYSILKTLSADTSPRSRVATTSVLSILFSSGKLYLAQAQHPPKSTNLPYFSWSHLLADLIESTHITLCDVVSQSQSVGSTLSILQCLTILLSNTPYHRMNKGILEAIIHALGRLLRHTDSTIRLAAIKCLIEIVVLESPTEEQISLMQHYNYNNDTKLKTESWIILYCLESIKNENLSVSIRAECWVLLGNLIKNHFFNINCSHHLSKIFELLRRDIEDNNIVIQQKAAKAFELMVIPLNLPEIDCGLDMYDIWLRMIQGPLVPMLQSTSGILASSAADCITNISPQFFEKLPERMRIFFMTALCGCVAHEDHIARSAAVRTLGTIVVFPFLSQNIQIIYDVADRIACTMRDSNLNVRSKAAWALGNLSDVLVDGRLIGVPIEEVPLLSVLEQAVATGNDHERVKAYTMRAIGNFLLLLDDHHLEIEKFQRLTEAAATTLTSNALNDNNMKVRWNACYSLGNMLKNTLLVQRVPTNWHINVLDTLSKLIESCSNFKVRKAAANALSVITNREYYGDQLKIIWPALLKAFENSQNLPEFSEYKHQEHLIDQLCLTLCHFCLLAHVEDLVAVSHFVSTEFVDTCKLYVVNLIQRNAEVKPKFDEAVENLRQLCVSSSNVGENNVVEAFIEILEVQNTF